MNIPIKYIDVKEMNAKLRENSGCRFLNMSEEIKKHKTISYGTSFLYSESDTYFYYYRNEGSMTHKHIRGYCCRKDDKIELCPVSSPIQCYQNLRQLSKFPVLQEKTRFCDKVGGILFNNPKYEKQWIDAESYDMNSAYGWAACQPMPDTTMDPLPSGRVQEGQIGFDLFGHLALPGELAIWRFPTIESPFIRYMNKWYDIKKKSEPGSKERKNAKEHIVVAVGYLEKVNFWLRAAIVGYVNRLIISLTGAYYDAELDRYRVDNENILFGNTDSIVVKRGYKLDLKLGNGMGEWKIEDSGDFAFVGFNHQWKGKLPSYRRIPKSLFTGTYDITRDPVPMGILPYKFNPQTKQLEDEEAKKCQKRKE